MKRIAAVLFCLVFLIVSGGTDTSETTTENNLSQIARISTMRETAIVMENENVGELSRGVYKVSVDILNVKEIVGDKTYRGVALTYENDSHKVGSILLDAEEIDLIIDTLKYAKDNFDIIEAGARVVYRTLTNQTIIVKEDGEGGLRRPYVIINFSSTLYWYGYFENIDDFISVFLKAQVALW